MASRRRPSGPSTSPRSTTPSNGSRSANGCARRRRSSRSWCRSRSSGSSSGSTSRRSRRCPSLIGGANPALVLVAFLVFYAGFPLRGYRWALLLRGTGFRIGVKDSTEIIYLSWLVNCVVPAKLGDLYRAYLLRINSDASLSRTFGTVFIERILDIVTIALMGIAAGYWSFRSGDAGGDPGHLRDRHRRGRDPRGGALHAAQLRAPDPDGADVPARTGSSSSTTASRRASSGPSRCASSRCSAG